jgi:collagen type III alpha
VCGKDGEPGKSVTVDDVSPLIADEIAKRIAVLPVPKDGEPGKSVDVEDIVPLIEKAFAGVQKPMDGINGKDGAPGAQGPAGRDGVGFTAALIGRDGHLLLTKSSGETEDIGEIVGRDGVDGKSVEIDEINALVTAEVTKQVGSIPIPLDGTDGAPGASVTLADVAPMLREMVSKAVSELPAAEKGDPGKSVSLEEVMPHILAAATEAIDAIPKPKDGVTIEEITSAIEVMVEKRVAAIPIPKDGRDGVDVADILIDRSGELRAVLSNGTTKSLGPVVGKDGKDAVAPEPPVTPNIETVPDALNEQIAKAVRLMAETPEINRFEPPSHGHRNSPVHVHMPNVIVPEIVIPDIHVPEMKAPDVNVTVMQPPKRKTMKTVKEFDTNGRIKKILEEEI